MRVLLDDGLNISASTNPRTNGAENWIGGYTRSSFFFRVHPFNCFSLDMASRISDVVSIYQIDVVFACETRIELAFMFINPSC